MNKGSCLLSRADALLAEGFDTQAKLDGLVEAQFPKVLMQQFVQDMLAGGWGCVEMSPPSTRRRIAMAALGRFEPFTTGCSGRVP